MTPKDDQAKHIMVYLDESGHIHRNSKCQYFAIGGFCCRAEDDQKIKSLYKRMNKKIKKNYNLSLDVELKASQMDDAQKIDLFNALKTSNEFCGVGIVFDKQMMQKPIDSENMFYNYGVKELFEDVIFPLVDDLMDEPNEEVVFHVTCDNRSMKSGDVQDLEKFLSTTFIEKNCSFKVEYGNSASNYSIQIADLIVNTAFMSKKDPESVENVLKTLDKNRFLIAYSPSEKYEVRAETLF